MVSLCSSAPALGVTQIDRVVEAVEETLRGNTVHLLQKKALPRLDLPKVEQHSPRSSPPGPVLLVVVPRGEDECQGELRCGSWRHRRGRDRRLWQWALLALLVFGKPFPPLCADLPSTVPPSLPFPSLRPPGPPQPPR